MTVRGNVLNMKNLAVFTLFLSAVAAQHFSTHHGFIRFGGGQAPSPAPHFAPRPPTHFAPRPVFAPAPHAFAPAPHSFAPAPAFSRPAAPAPAKSTLGNYEFGGKRYLLSWRQGQNKLTHSAASSYCRGNGMRVISLDSSDKIHHFFQLLQGEHVEYFWTGGSLSRDKSTLTWENGRSEGIHRGQFPWSDKGRRGPQPDGVNDEYCLAILKNVYQDGVKFHDVGCQFEKPTICEEI